MSARPDTPDEYLLLRHGFHDIVARPLRVYHKLVALRGNISEIVLVEEGEDILPDIADDLAALRYECLHFERGIGSDHAGYRESAGAIGADLLEDVGSCNGSTSPESSHSVQLRESTKDEHVLVSRDH